MSPKNVDPNVVIDFKLPPCYYIHFWTNTLGITRKLYKYVYIYLHYVYIYRWMVGWLVGFYGKSTFEGYLTPNPFL